MTAQNLMISIKSTHSHIVDKLGVTLSFLCAIHCALAPLLVVFFPSLEVLKETETAVHVLLAVVLFGITLLAFYRGYLQHNRKDIVALATAGMGSVVFALFLHDDQSHSEVISSEAVVTTIGSTLLILAHVLNLKNMSCCKTTRCSHGSK